MKITFFINYLNHHQVLVADEMYKLFGSDFTFVATFPRDKKELKGGMDFSMRPYCLLPAERGDDNNQAHLLNITSDVCVYGAGNLMWEVERAKSYTSHSAVKCNDNNYNKVHYYRLSFEMSERWFKRGWKNVLSPRFLQWWWLSNTKFKGKPFFKLCASAYTSVDCAKIGLFKNRCFKWGYFTMVDDNVRMDDIRQTKDIKMMWCARFIDWKHPELPIQLIARLKKTGFLESNSIHLDMYGDGVMLSDMMLLAKNLDVEKYITFYGNLPNDKIRIAMRNHDIFLFTSDRNEGWGAVANEAMSEGCLLIGSDEIGSIPYLVKNGVNGLIYKNGVLQSLYETTIWAIENPKECLKIRSAGLSTMKGLWSPANAARSLSVLISALLKGYESPIKEGPCSKA